LLVEPREKEGKGRSITASLAVRAKRGGKEKENRACRKKDVPTPEETDDV